MTKEQLQDKCRGSLVGGAIGDALGYAVEFSSWYSIKSKFGERGITEYELNKDGIAEFSDDTQMSLFTAEGLLTAITDGMTSEELIHSCIRSSYEHWYATQTRSPYPIGRSWLSNVAALWSQRAPGMTCMDAMHQISFGDGLPVVNDSKGCGGVMRVAPIGIYAAAHADVMTPEVAGDVAGAAAEVTHKHPLSTFSSMALAMIVAECIREEEMNRDKFKDIVIDRVFKSLGQRFRRNDALADLFNLILKALYYGTSKDSEDVALRDIGQGWVAEETLAIAFFSVMRHIDNFEKCVVCSVNHSGDSDSTGAVAGNIIGAILGYSAIPDKYLANLEVKDVIVSVADDLCGCSSEEQMTARYINSKPYGIDEKFLI
ncbi:MAG: ADP-ribosylglycohydrolase family protein [Muribaculum sp.]|nr:ADP-ribosylglycohydrolase family protein [Muribaculum sp.]